MFVYPPSKTLLDDQKRLNRPEEVEQYFLVYGFYMYRARNTIPRLKDRMRRRRRTKITLLWQQEEKTTYIQSKETTQ